MRTEEDIFKLLLNDASIYYDEDENIDNITYAEGALAALCWVLGVRIPLKSEIEKKELITHNKQLYTMETIHEKNKKRKNCNRLFNRLRSLRKRNK